MDDELAFLILKFGIRSTIHVPIAIAGSPFAVVCLRHSGNEGLRRA